MTLCHRESRWAFLLFLFSLVALSPLILRSWQKFEVVLLFCPSESVSVKPFSSQNTSSDAFCCCLCPVNILANLYYVFHLHCLPVGNQSLLVKLETGTRSFQPHKPCPSLNILFVEINSDMTGWWIQQTQGSNDNETMNRTLIWLT